jgi:molybdopterin-guanine dinucleotide biosynthesis protein A
VVLLAVDQPFVRAETLDSLLAEPGDAVVPLAGGWLQATCAVYRSACLDRVQTLLEAEERSLQSLLATVARHVVEEPTWRNWGEDGRSWFSVDSRDRLTEGLVRYR